MEMGCAREEARERSSALMGSEERGGTLSSDRERSVVRKW